MEAVEALNQYNQIPIVTGMIIMILIFSWFMYYQNKMITKFKESMVVHITPMQAVDITAEMLKTLSDVPISEVSIGKRASKLQHDVTEALSPQNKDNLMTVLSELVDETKEVNRKMEEFYKSQGEKTDRLNETILKFILKSNYGSNNRDNNNNRDH